MPRYIVSEEPYRTSPETGEARDPGRLSGSEPPIQVFQRIGGFHGPPPRLGMPKAYLPTLQTPGFPGLASQEGVTGPLFSPDHRLQKEAEGRPVELFVGRDRSIGIEEKLPPYRDNPRITGERQELREGREKLHDLDSCGDGSASPFGGILPTGARMNVPGY